MALTKEGGLDRRQVSGVSVVDFICAAYFWPSHGRESHEKSSLKLHKNI
jgi:hypothetical protein